MPKQRTHREWFRPVSLGGRKSCPTCKAKLPPGEKIWSWFEYQNMKQHVIDRCCINCFFDTVFQRLIKHREECGCEFELVGYDHVLPPWLVLPSREELAENPDMDRPLESFLQFKYEDDFTGLMDGPDMMRERHVTYPSKPKPR